MPHRHVPRNLGPCRRGAATLWVIVALPAVLCLLALVVESGNAWLARAELINAVEAAALAGVDQWGDAGNSMANRDAARARAVALFEANRVNGQSLAGLLAANGGGGGANDNSVCVGAVVILGAADISVTPPNFDAGDDPTAASRDYAVHARATVPVNSLLAQICGVALAPADVTAQATARYNGGDPRLIRVGVFTCP